MTQINKSVLGIITVKNILLCWIVLPITIDFLRYMCASYKYNEETLYIQTGIINKKREVIPLYRIVDITAHANVLNVGEIIIQDKNKEIKLRFVSTPLSQLESLMSVWKSARKNEGVKTHDIL